MIKSITIENFRGIKHLEISDLGIINIFVGKNGVGKTSVLEAISLASSPSIETKLKIDTTRKTRGPSTILRSLFHDLRQPVTLTFQQNDEEYRLQIRPNHLSSQSITDVLDATTYATVENLTLASIEQTVFKNQTEIFRQTLALNDSGKLKTQIEFGPTKDIRSLSGGFFIEARRAYSDGETSRMLTRMRRMRKIDILIDTLRILQPTLQGIDNATNDDGDPDIDVDLGDKIVSYKLMGDGFARLLLILTGVYATGSHSLIVDEIDSGFHYTALPKIWRTLVAGLEPRGNERQKQLFCATHNEEMLEATLSALEDIKEDVRIFRIERTKDNELRVIKISYDKFETVKEMGLNVR